MRQDGAYAASCLEKQLGAADVACLNGVREGREVEKNEGRERFYGKTYRSPLEAVFGLWNLIGFPSFFQLSYLARECDHCPVVFAIGDAMQSNNTRRTYLHEAFGFYTVCR